MSDDPTETNDDEVRIILDQDGLVPTKQPLPFSLANYGGDKEDFEPLLVQIKTEFEKKLFRWKEFPLVLPEPINDAIGSSAKIEPQDLFTFPDFSELEQIALGSNGNSKSLSNEQFVQIRKNGEFTVPSVNFPGQNHRWRLSLLLQRGSDRDRKNLHKTLAFALKLIVIYAKGRIKGKRFSLWKSLLAWLKIPKYLINILIGYPDTIIASHVGVITRQRLAYITQDFAVLDADVVKVKRLQEFVLEQLAEEYYLKRTPPSEMIWPALVYKFLASGATQLDFSLCEPAVWLTVENRLKQILTIVSKDDSWLSDFREQFMESQSSLDKTEDKTHSMLLQAVRDKFIQKIYSAIVDDEQLENIGQSVPMLVIDQAKSISIVERAERNLLAEHDRTLANYETDLKLQYPIRSLIKVWLRKHLARKSDDFWQLNRHQVLKETLETAKDEGLQHLPYLLERALDFEQNQRPVIKARLDKIKQPSRVFTWRRRIWFPSNWLVTRTDPSTRQQTRLTSLQFVNSVLERSTISDVYADSNRIDYQLIRDVKWTNDTKYPFWRKGNIYRRYCVWTCNYMFNLLVAIPLCSGIGLRALFSPVPFYPDYELNPQDGSIWFSAASKTHSYISRIRSLWKHIRKARKTFEDTPDRGFLGKSVTRPLNKFWNYVIKGAVGTVILTLGMPIACAFVSVASVIAGVTCPVWMMLVVLIHHLFLILVFDLDAPRKSDGKNRICLLLDFVLYRFLFLAVVQPICAFLTAFILCPMGSIITTLAAYLRHGLRSSWDWIMYHLLIKRFARVPASNSFVARRVAGPGLSAHYFYQVQPEQALALLQLRIEKDELAAYESAIIELIDSPMALYSKIVKDVLGSFGAVFNRDAKSNFQYALLYADATKLKTRLQNLVSARRQELRVGLTPSQRDKIRLSAVDLNRTVRAAAQQLRLHYPQRVLDRMTPDQRKKFWKSIELPVDDWEGLASHLLSEIFSKEFVIPLEEGESRFQLEVEHLGVKSYFGQLISAQHKEDLEDAVPVQMPSRSKRYRIQLPSVSSEMFTHASTVISGSGLFNDAQSVLGQLVSRGQWESQIGLINARIYNSAVIATGDSPIPVDNADCHRLLTTISTVRHNKQTV